MAGFQLTLYGRIWATPEDLPFNCPRIGIRTAVKEHHQVTHRAEPDHLANSKHLARSDATVSPICVISTGDDVGRRSRVYGGSECVWHAICEGYGIHGDIVSLFLNVRANKLDRGQDCHHAGD